jgi:exosortase D (VPLPA-CTERM-specific)
LFVLLAILVYLGFAHAIDFMVGQWSMDEFSHGYLIPFISAFLIWQRRAALQRLQFTGSWYGLGIVLFGLALNAAGRLSALYPIQHFAFLIVIVGLVLALAGWQVLRVLAAPLGVLIFMIPLPNFLLGALSSELQLISSSLGVWLIRLAGVAVLLEGNVIDLGTYKLEVAEACSGLRYLLPLMTLAFLIGCFYRGAVWKRVLVFLSSIPLTLVMNSLRIAIIGVTVDRWGSQMAEGMLHEVQGWTMFMLSTAILLGEVALLARFGKDKQPWRAMFHSTVPAAPTASVAPGRVSRRYRTLSPPLIASGVAVLLFSVTAVAMPGRIERPPARDSFSSFPLQLGAWAGQREVMDKAYLDVLKLDDYLMADYARADGRMVNLYVAWYDAQSTGEATHSPRGCLPGGGWQIEDLRQIQLPSLKVGAHPLRVNRVLIQYGDQRQLVYYWFQQRGRVVTNEYLVKWYLLVDAVTKHRTDGALVRVIVPLAPSAAANEADHELQSFLGTLTPTLTKYVPS